MSYDGEYRLETPENIEVSFDLAGPGSRFCSLLIDGLLMFLLIFVIVLIAAISDASWFRDFEEDVRNDQNQLVTWVRAIAILAASLVMAGYFAFFEIVMRGQTPGKRSMKLRVLRDDGTPAAALDIIIRNLVRVVDFLPAGYALGGTVCLISKLHQRIGDMAAGTIVVKEAPADYRAAADRKRTVPIAAAIIENAALSPAEQRLIRGFLQRRAELLPDARRELASRLARSLIEKHGGQLDDPEAYLERLSRGRQHES